MLTEEVLAHPPKVFSQEQRQFYFDNGYLSLDSIVPMAWVERLRAATEEMVERSRYADTIVRGKPARWAHHDPRPGRIPPDWSKGYTSLFAMQQEEALDQGSETKLTGAGS